jgi:hypothetical protein
MALGQIGAKEGKGADFVAIKNSGGPKAARV